MNTALQPPVQPVESAEAVRHWALDAVRGVAILLVLAHHVAFSFPPATGDVVARFFRGIGWAGVDMFFALSGFLIATILLRTSGGSGVRRFFVRRFFRIIPLFVVAVLLYVLATYVQLRSVASLDGIWATALLLNGWVIPFWGVENVPFTITWSLSVEESAYLLLGCSALLARAGVQRMLLAMLACALVVRAGWALAYPTEMESVYYFVPARLDSIAYGGLVALGFVPRWTRSAAGPWIAAGSVFAILVVFSFSNRANPWMAVLGYPAFGLACAALVASLTGATPRRTIAWLRPLCWLGQVSYFVYLFHMFVIAIVAQLATKGFGVQLPYWPALTLALALTCTLAAMSWRYFEAPLIAAGRRIAP